MKRHGSAIITVISAIVILTVLALSFVASRTEKVGISKHLSDEKKVEALAESASDLVLSYIKKNANQHDTADQLYYLLRAPLKYKNSGSFKDNMLLNVDGLQPVDHFETTVGYNATLDSVIEDLGWKDSVTLESKCELVNAEAFTPAKSGYKVTGITTAHLDAMGKSAKFLDSKPDSITFDRETDADVWANGNWKININFPGNDQTYEEKKFKVHIQLNSNVSDAIREFNDATDAYNEAKKEYEKAKKDGKTGDSLKPYKDAMDEAEQKMKEAEGDWGDAEKDSDDGLGINVKLKVKRNDAKDMKFYIEAEVCITKWLLDLFGIDKYYYIKDEKNNTDYWDVDKKIEDTRFFPDIRPVKLSSLRNKVTGSESQPDYDFSTYVSEISSRMGEVKSGFSNIGVSNLDPDFNDPMLIEKGGVLRITTTAKYEPKDSKKVIKRILVSEIPFKVSDVQPIAPEYTFFVANSPLISGENKNAYTHTLGEKIDMNNAMSGTTFTSGANAAGRFVVHNLPLSGDGKPSYSLIGGSTGRIPGMVRINTEYSSKGDPTTDIRTFIGCFEEPELTEMNQMFTPYENSVQNPFNTVPSFCWTNDKGNPINAQRKHEVEFPVMLQFNAKNKKIENPGIMGFMDVYHRSGFDIVMVPTLLYGHGHMEYPLGINSEGPINTIYSRLRVGAFPNAIVCPDADKVVTDATEIYYSYEQCSTYSNGSSYDFNETANNTQSYEPAVYGMVNHGSYKVNQGGWHSNKEFKYMPANCYDALQYAKKATRFYETGAKFLEDCDKDKAKGGLKNNGSVELNGVYYIKCSDKDDSLIFSKPMTFSGNGLIVAKKSIQINSDISLSDKEKDSLGIIARSGNITFNCSKVEAACFSNIAPELPEGKSSPTKIYGNLVCNDFDRAALLDVEILYDNRITSVNPLASLRKAGKFEPKRYSVAFADNWSKFTYEKNKDE
ncbi:MAG: hypothetical protein II567_00305 [Candidatus Riflebacteria bacterium]|nr:hypothetical protein [Candidatus Riflebacteria bacterium]